MRQPSCYFIRMLYSNLHPSYIQTINVKRLFVDNHIIRHHHFMLHVIRQPSCYATNMLYAFKLCYNLLTCYIYQHTRPVTYYTPTLLLRVTDATVYKSPIDCFAYITFLFGEARLIF